MKKIILVISAVLVAVIAMRRLSPEGSASAYQEMLAAKKDFPELLGHFPDPMPPNARLIALNHSSGWGSRWAAHFEGLDESYLNMLRQGRSSGPDDSFDAGEYIWRWLAPSLKLDGKPGDYESILLKNRTGNHGHRVGVSIGKQRRNALFWAERW